MKTLRTLPKPRLNGTSKLIVCGALVALLSGCGGQDTQPQQAPDVTERFTGILPCKDCSGLRQDLVLKRDADTLDPTEFLLNEERIDAPGGERTRSSWGEWEILQARSRGNRAIYHLIPERGEERYFERYKNGLQPINARGRALAPMGPLDSPLLLTERGREQLKSQTQVSQKQQQEAQQQAKKQAEQQQEAVRQRARSEAKDEAYRHARPRTDESRWGWDD
ncbi:hypothetical protein BFW38_05755 [Terasakiispira papahanaumokuakeensis]|uniref:Uncharacterized protein n=1 Tax=Terasakiispira papahanaumokuakeensis TaxID=197479 RepID=A0A1E2V830_9GAMM|nr:copper resistance protein NlpE N-terminal domain-containing protein [Terasakiispira papahanaumokuakeensis]ODC03124.1 hypothetical protein BFW38_05755 [Terasakiispira papahanaumokuakeensis]